MTTVSVRRCRGRWWSGPGIAAALLFVVSALPVWADQTHPELDSLFQRLAVETDPVAARTLEVRIWELWGAAPDTSSQALLHEGIRAMAEREFEVAVDLFDLLIADYPGFAEAWNRRATVQYLLGYDDASLRDIEETLSLEPRHFGAWSGMGLVLMRLEDYDGAEAAFEAALRVHPNMMGPRMNLRLLEGRRRDGIH